MRLLTSLAGQANEEVVLRAWGLPSSAGGGVQNLVTLQIVDTFQKLYPHIKPVSSEGLIIPDPEMWTMMVWVFQLQSTSDQAVLYASLVTTAIPTFLVFVFRQNIIIRGIVVPVEK